MITYGLDQNIIFDKTYYEKNHVKYVYGMPLDPKEVELRSSISYWLSIAKNKLKAIDYIYKQISELDSEQLQLFPDESFFYALGKKIMDLHTLWSTTITKAYDKDFYDKRWNEYLIIAEDTKKLDEIYKEVLESRKVAGLNIVNGCKYGQRIRFMHLDLCVPIVEHYREVAYRFQGGDFVKDFNQEHNTRIKYNEKLLEAIDLLKSVNHEDEVFLNLSEEIQKTYNMWISIFNAPRDDDWEIRQQQLEVMNVIIPIIKKEIEKYNLSLADAEEEKQRILQEVAAENQEEAVAQMELQQREKDFAEEAKLREKYYEDDLQKQLALIDAELDKQFNFAVSELNIRHAQEVEQIKQQYPQVMQQESQVNKPLQSTGILHPIIGVQEIKQQYPQVMQQEAPVIGVQEISQQYPQVMQQEAPVIGVQEIRQQYPQVMQQEAPVIGVQEIKQQYPQILQNLVKPQTSTSQKNTVVTTTTITNSDNEKLNILKIIWEIMVGGLK